MQHRRRRTNRRKKTKNRGKRFLRALEVAGELMENGYVAGGASLGISVVVVEEEPAAASGLEAGIYIEQRDAGGAADKAGLLAGDRITAVNGSPASTLEDLSDTPEGKKAGDTLEITVERENKALIIAVKLKEAALMNN